MAGTLGLPRNAWTNAKTYADTAFPVNAVVGDRILRTDLGRWFTFVTIGGADYWAPEAGSIVASARQATATSLSAATDTHVINLSTIIYNYDGWWTNHSFLPKVPGYYLCGGGVGFDIPVTVGTSREAWLQKNGTTNVPGSGNRAIPISGTAVTVPVRPVPVFLNGTTDFVRIFARSSTAVDTVANSNYLTTHFWAQFTGPFVE